MQRIETTKSSPNEGAESTMTWTGQVDVGQVGGRMDGMG